ncbi:MAG: sigma-70 family RNA polymerase sigma factor [Rubrivivax sp.]|nr:sigma-70 family RNA polymerase sigma factor [Rubrivivax sp.]
MQPAATNDPWRRHRAELRRFVGRRVFDRHEAEDIVQEALARAHEARHQLRSPEQLPAWLARIAANLIVDTHRARRPGDELPEDLAAPEPEDDPVARLATCLPGLVEDLPGTFRDAVRWSGLEGLPQREVARRLGISLSGAKSRVQRGRALLRRQIEACCRVLVVRGAITGFERRAPCRPEGRAGRAGCAGGGMTPDAGMRPS